MAKPEVQLLANGDILVPERAAAGGWSISRFTPEQEGYADWLTVVQQRARQPGLLARGVSFWLTGVLVVVGLFFAIALLSLLASGGVRH
jgi:hypothetical protein